jgi:hypothetical protein
LSGNRGVRRIFGSIWGEEGYQSRRALSGTSDEFVTGVIDITLWRWSFTPVSVSNKIVSNIHIVDNFQVCKELESSPENTSKAQRHLCPLAESELGELHRFAFFPPTGWLILHDPESSVVA